MIARGSNTPLYIDMLYRYDVTLLEKLAHHQLILGRFPALCDEKALGRQSHEIIESMPDRGWNCLRQTGKSSRRTHKHTAWQVDGRQQKYRVQAGFGVDFPTLLPDLYKIQTIMDSSQSKTRYPGQKQKVRLQFIQTSVIRPTSTSPISPIYLLGSHCNQWNCHECGR